MAASRTINLVMNQGEDFAYTTLIYANTFVTENLGLDTLDTANAQMRKSYYHANATATFAVNINHTAAETVSIYLAAANTAAISPGRYVYDLEYYDNDGNQVSGAPFGNSRRFRALEGMITVTPEVTK